MANRDQDFITEARTATKQIWDAQQKLRALQAEFIAGDYTNTLDDGAGNNEGILAADVSAVVNTTSDAIVGLFAAGHATNIIKML